MTRFSLTFVAIAFAAALSFNAAAQVLGSGSHTPAAAGELTKKYQPIADRIIAETLKDNRAYDKLTELCDDIGHRLSGSKNLERAVDWAVATLKRDRHENVRAEPVMVPHWVRGRESAEMIEPRHMELSMLGLGGSVATPAEGITAEVVAVTDREELESLGEAVRGKIVVFNHAMPPYTEERGTSYGTTVQYRSNGAAWAAKNGAVAALIRSVTARSLRSPHTGAMRYEDGVTKVPTAAISIEDADTIYRLCKRGVKVVIRLKMEARFEPDAPSANVVAELRGREKPEEVVVIGGHLDSWDVGQGAHDDGGACIAAWHALLAIKEL
ncbi:MAG: M28 family peptidase, partial [Phycisphaerales bacterium]|nr:M28 family peptidase [Phycisphaerales bacterium]